MPTWFTLRNAQPTPSAIELADAIEKDASRLRTTQSDTGGLNRARLRKAILPSLVACDLTDKDVDSFTGREIDLWSAASGLAVSLQTGRAYTNNGALLAVLAAAAHRPIDWVVITVPEAYKGGAQANPVCIQLGGLVKARGIALDLDGIAVISY